SKQERVVDATRQRSFARPRLSIVVLPFELLGGDPADGYLADGITEDLTTDLSHVPGTLVIARGSAYSYRGKATDVRRIGAELGVRYVVEGSVRRLGATLRVNAQLIFTEDDAQLWAHPVCQPPARGACDRPDGYRGSAQRSGTSDQP